MHLLEPCISLNLISFSRQNVQAARKELVNIVYFLLHFFLLLYLFFAAFNFIRNYVVSV